MRKFVLDNPIIFSGSLGIEAIPGVPINASAPITASFKAIQDISTSGNPKFNQLNANSVNISDDKFIIQKDGDEVEFVPSGAFDVTGSVNVNNGITIPGDFSVGGILKAKDIQTKLQTASTIFPSGSTKFGDDLNDTHSVTGSMSVSGSFNLNGTDLIEISNNSDVTAARSNVLITENAAKAALGGDIELNNQYMRKIFAHTGSISNSTASFSAVTASVSTDLTSTTKQDFQFYLNGMLLEQDALTIQQSSSVFELHMNASSLGYNLSNSDEIVAWGKFNS